MNRRLDRREFLRTSAALAGTALAAPWIANHSAAAAAAGPAVTRTAVDQVALGRTGLQLSRLGLGTGINAGRNLTALGQEGFNQLVRYAYDQGVTYFDCAERYATFEWIGDAIKPLPREKLFIQSKIPGQPDDVLAAIDRHRKVFDTDYIDSMLIHCMVRDQWTDEWKRVMDGFNEAKARKWIRAKGVSCHTLGALRAATASEWNEVHLVRVNPQGSHMDAPSSPRGERSRAEVAPVMAEIKKMHDLGRGVIGMKIIGNGDFQNAGDREKSIRFAMACADIDAIVIGFETKSQIDEAIERMNRALAS